MESAPTIDPNTALICLTIFGGGLLSVKKIDEQ